MPIPILMPALSPTMTSGKLVNWYKQPGDFVKAGDLLAEIETDKATMEVEAVDEGILGAIVVPANTPDVTVNTTIGWLLEEGETPESIVTSSPQVKSVTFELPAQEPTPLPTSLPPEISASPSSTALTPTAPSQERIPASPLARRLAKQNNIPLANLQGTGPRGRIIQRDIVAFLEKPSQTLPAGAPLTPNSPLPSVAFSGHEPDFTLLPLTRMRQTIAERLTAAKQTIPHFYLNISCRLTRIVALRETLKKRNDVVPSINDFVLKACAMAAYEIKDVNAAWSAEGIRKYTSVDIAVAVAIDQGLITPVLRSAHTKNLKKIQEEVRDLADRARAGKLMPQEYQGGTLTVSNLGMYGIEQFSPIINPPQAAILAVGAAAPTPVAYEDGSLGVESVMHVTLAADHRVIDGAVGAQFLSAFKKFMEEPAFMLI